MSSTHSTHKKSKRRKKKSTPKTDTLDTGLWLKRGFIASLSIIGILVLLYLGMALFGVLVPVNPQYKASATGIPIYVISNGFHTDIAVPIQENNTRTNWLRLFNDSTLTAQYQNYDYVSFGWGDEDFYMASYNNEFPSLLTCIDALCIPSNSLMHIEFYRYALKENGKDVVKIILSPEQYNHLVNYIDNSLLKEDSNKYVPKNAKGYSKHDYFYYAIGNYHVLNTCNDWTNNGLQWVGIKTASKAPFAMSVLYYLH